MPRQFLQMSSAGELQMSSKARNKKTLVRTAPGRCDSSGAGADEGIASATGVVIGHALELAG